MQELLTLEFTCGICHTIKNIICLDDPEDVDTEIEYYQCKNNCPRYCDSGNNLTVMSTFTVTKVVKK